MTAKITLRCTHLVYNLFTEQLKFTKFSQLKIAEHIEKMFIFSSRTGHRTQSGGHNTTKKSSSHFRRGRGGEGAITSLVSSLSQVHGSNNRLTETNFHWSIEAQLAFVRMRVKAKLL